MSAKWILRQFIAHEGNSVLCLTISVTYRYKKKLMISEDWHMPFRNIPVDVWRTVWAELEQVVIGGGSSRDVVSDARPDTSRASHWLVSGNSIVFLKAVTRLAYSRYGLPWDGPQTSAVARFLSEKKFPVVRDNQLREGIGGLNPANLLDKGEPLLAPEYETVRRLSRAEQAQFRANLKRVYGSRCAISGCEVEVVLDACHILGHAAGGSTKASNGILLRKDLHRLFDLGLVAVDPEERTWRFHEDLVDHYSDLCKDRRGPDFELADNRLHRLAMHWQASQLL